MVGKKPVNMVKPVRKRKKKGRKGKVVKDEDVPPKGTLLSSKVPGKLKAFIELIRPFTLMAPIIGGTSAALISYRVNIGTIPMPYMADVFPYLRWDFPEATTIIWGVLALVFVNAASNTINQVYDLDIDKVNKPYRPIPSERITKDEARTLAWILYLLTLWRAAWLNRTFAFFILLLMLMTIAYSVPPMRLKKRLWVNNGAIAVARGLFGFVAAWSMFDENPFDNSDPWAMGLVMCIFLFGTITTKDFTDIKGDSKYGMRTIPVVFGTRFAAAFTALFFILPFVVLPLLTMFGYLISETFVLTVLMVWGVYVLVLIHEAAYKREDAIFENTPVWKHMYLMLLALQFGFLIIYYFYHPGPAT
jgi:4-hydroxybenzoate polyprenyltransferase